MYECRFKGFSINDTVEFITISTSFKIYNIKSRKSSKMLKFLFIDLCPAFKIPEFSKEVIFSNDDLSLIEEMSS